ncbi:MAG TPA: hypothetical protein VFV42_11605 [Acidimicrobiales bacterium]|nr:hypothetical protein [Acidimicrobiales bacterium]
MRATIVAVAALGAAAALLPGAGADEQRPPTDLAADAVATAAGACDELDTRLCLLPFPNDRFTTLDPSTPTGRRVDLSPLATPRSLGAKPMDPTEWNRNDGFSPGAMVLTYVPQLDLTATFGLDPEPETGPGMGDPFAVRDALPDAVLEAPELSMAPDAPIVLLDADTGERHPYWAELDEHAVTIEEGRDRTLIVRPLVNFEEGHRYIVALRDLRAADGTELAPTPAFTALRDGFTPPPAPECRPHPGKGKGKGNPPAEVCEEPVAPAFPAPADIDPADDAARYGDIFTRLDASGVDVSDLYLAWDFHVASAENLAGRALAIRDDAFAQLGDTDLADLVVEGDSPAITIGEVVDEGTTRTVHGSVTVPNYLTTPQDGLDPSAVAAAGDLYDQLPAELRANDPGVSDLVDLADEVPVVVPQSRFVYESPAPGPMDTPIQNPLLPTLEAEFTCKLRTDVPGGAKPTLYGHGLLGGRGEGEGGSTGDLRNGGHAMCAVDWIGMATEDIVNVALILHDISLFPSLADRAQQGFLNFLYVGRALIHPEGAVTQPAFQAPDGTPLLDIEELYYDGNSQGGIMGGALTALAPDFTKSVLGVPGINYSTLLNRSVDWEGELIDLADPGLPAYGSLNYNAYPDKVGQQLVFALLQMLWDRGEGNAYAHHMTDDPYPNTPPHQVLLEVAFGDYQVTNHAAEVEARTIGADYLTTALAPGRHWERRVAAGTDTAPFGLTPFATGADGTVHAPSGSALVYWDSGNPTPPNGNVPPPELDQDPHGDPRNDDVALVQKLRFYSTGVIADVHGGSPNWTFRCPRHPEQDPGC